MTGKVLSSLHKEEKEETQALECFRGLQSVGRGASRKGDEAAEVPLHLIPK